MTENTDWIAAERDHEFRMEKEKTRQTESKAQARVGVAQTVGTVVGIIAVLGLLVGAVWTGVENSSERGHAESVACLQSGGTMVETTDGVLCLHLKDGVEQ